MTRGNSWQLAVAGVAGGVGTSTWSRIVARAWPQLQVRDGGVYEGGLLDILVTSTTAAATSRLAPALGACPRPPILVMMNTVPYRMPALSRAVLRRATPHIARLVVVGHQRSWPELTAAPGKIIPKAAADAVRDLADALTAMYAPGRVNPASAPSPVRSGVSAPLMPATAAATSLPARTSGHPVPVVERRSGPTGSGHPPAGRRR